MRKILLAYILSMQCILVLANNYEDAWKALNRNDRKAARELLQKAMNDPETAMDAYMTYVYLLGFDNQTHTIHDFEQKAYTYSKDPSSYIYALWFNDAVMGQYGKKKPHQLHLTDRLINDPSTNGSLRSAARYVKGFHLIYVNKGKEGQAEWVKMGGIENWQFAGPFSNISMSGYYKNYEPITKPGPESVFKSLNNANIQWFTPGIPCRDGWVAMKYNFENSTAVVFGQSFVYSPTDQEVLICAGASGSLKIWVNDKLCIAESKERVTELDYYKNRCTLKKGYNRVLVQLGYTGNSYPNFIVKLANEKFEPVAGLSSTNSYQPYPSKTEEKSSTLSVTHFAEAYFADKIKASPNNLINYLLLAKVYARNENMFEARKILEQALQKTGKNNMLVQFELIECLLKTDNRTKLLEEVDIIKEKDPDCVFSLILKINDLISENKFEEARERIEYYTHSFGFDETIWDYKLKLAEKTNNNEEWIRFANEAYEQYPFNAGFAQYKFYLLKNNQKDPTAAAKIYKTFLDKEYNGTLMKALTNEYFTQGIQDKGLELLMRQYTTFTFDPQTMIDLASYYYGQQDYETAMKYCDYAVHQNPYSSTYWNNVGLVAEALGKKQEAIDAYTKAVYYSPNKFDAHEKIRMLKGEPDLWKAFPQYDIYDLIKKSDHQDPENGFYYILNEEFAIVYPEGTNQKYYSYAAKILNQDGIDFWKEMNLPYNSNTQTLNIEKAEIVKKNGNKIAAETNENQLVFANIEIGDVVYIKYKIQNYAYGRLARECWDKFNFDLYKFSEHSRYCLLIADNIEFRYKTTGEDIQPEITPYGKGYTLYTWDKDSLPAISDESYMPPINDVGKVLHISSVKSWNEIAQWYSDLSYKHTEDDFELKETFETLFPQTGKSYTDMEKARIIFEYISKNITYSSVSFRQSGYVPQSPSKTIATRLGDCKDLSSLFVALAHMANLDANLVLIDTRDNGFNDMVLPSFEFNHCIAKFSVNDTAYYLELTGKNSPFLALPKELFGALSLNIPPTNEGKDVDTLRNLYVSNRLPDKVKRTIRIKVNGDDLDVQESVVKYGSLSSDLRYEYATLSPNKQKEQMAEAVNKRYQKTVLLDTVAFSNLDNWVDSVTYYYRYTVKDVFVEIGDLKSFQPKYADQIASLDGFTSDKRVFPVDYWEFENTDVYETDIYVTVPTGKSIIQVPQNKQFAFGKSTYSITFSQKSPTELVIKRRSNMDRTNITPDRYLAMKNFFNDIIKTEGKYIVVK